MTPITLTASRAGRFLSASIPFPRGTYKWETGLVPFSAYVGTTEVPCQVERICRYAGGATASVMVYVDASAPSVRLEWNPHRETQRFAYHPRIKEIRSLLPVRPNTNPTMNGDACKQLRLSRPDLEGVATFFHDCASVRIDVILHNAHPGSREAYFDGLVFLNGVVPVDWAIEYIINEPIGTPQGAIRDGITHFMPQRGAREICAVLHPIDDANWRDVAIDQGLAFALHEWQTHHAWAPHFTPLADVSWLTSLWNQQTLDYRAARDAHVAGSIYPPGYNYPNATRHGFLHPGYGEQAGETGGTGITYAPPAVSGNPDLILRAMHETRFRGDRHRSAIIRTDGNQATYEDYKAEIDGGQIRFASDNFGIFDKSGGVTLDGSMGWSKQPPAAASAERTALMNYQNTDIAHRIRPNSWDSILLQLTNHWPSRYRLRMEGELARMAQHSGGRLNGIVGYANQGLGWAQDRNCGWAMWCMGMAYALGSSDVRTRFGPDIHRYVAAHAPAVARGAMLSALTSGKQCGKTPPDNPPTHQDETYGGQYAVCVGPTAQGLLTQGLWAAARAVGAPESADIAREAARSVEYLRDGQTTVWSAATYELGVKVPYLTRQPGLDSAAWSHDPEQVRPMLAFLGFELMEQGAQGMPAWDALIDQIESMLGPTPTAKLKGMGNAVTDSDLMLLAFCMKAGLP